MYWLPKVKILDELPEFGASSTAKVVTMGNITEITVMKRKAQGAPTRKLDNDHFVDLRTGEVREYEHIENRAGSAQSIRHTLARIRALVNTNVTDADRVRWLTLTYRENMTDPDRLYNDYKKFWQKFCRWCKKNGVQKPEYITVQEPQGRGAWHVHAFFIWPDCKAPFLPNDEIADLWKQGFTKTKAVNDVDNIGAYFSAYLGDMPLEEVQALPEDEQAKAMVQAVSVQEKEVTDSNLEPVKKKFVKGGRLYLYPPKMNIIRYSQGIKEPTVEYTTKKEAQKKVSAATETFTRAYEILSDEGESLNVYCKTYYNSKRKKPQVT